MVTGTIQKCDHQNKGQRSNKREYKTRQSHLAQFLALVVHNHSTFWLKHQLPISVFAAGTFM